MDREVECNARLPDKQFLSILIETSTSELLFLKKYSPYSEIEMWKYWTFFKNTLFSIIFYI